MHIFSHSDLLNVQIFSKTRHIDKKLKFCYLTFNQLLQQETVESCCHIPCTCKLYRTLLLFLFWLINNKIFPKNQQSLQILVYEFTVCYLKASFVELWASTHAVSVYFSEILFVSFELQKPFFVLQKKKTKAINIWYLSLL